jgi:hypothetical protein
LSTCSALPGSAATDRQKKNFEMRPNGLFFTAKIVIAIVTILIASVPTTALTWLS